MFPKAPIHISEVAYLLDTITKAKQSVETYKRIVLRLHNLKRKLIAKSV